MEESRVIPNWVMKMPWMESTVERTELLLTREWLVTNGLGGYAAGTIPGVASRRYHGLLNAALPAPLGRHMMFNQLTEFLRLPDGSTAFLGCEDRGGKPLDLAGVPFLKSFRLELGLPVWTYEVGGIVMEKRVFLPHNQNTVYVNYRLVESKQTVRLKLRPALHFRPHEAPVSRAHYGAYSLSCLENRYEISVASGGLPPLRMYLYGQRTAFTLEGTHLVDLLYRVEESRGYEARGDLWCPGYFRADLTGADEVTLVASTETWETVLALKPAEALDAERNRRQRLIALAEPAGDFMISMSENGHVIVPNAWAERRPDRRPLPSSQPTAGRRSGG